MSLFLGNTEADSHGSRLVYPNPKEVWSLNTQHTMLDRKDAIHSAFLELIESLQFPGEPSGTDRSVSCTTKQRSSHDKSPCVDNTAEVNVTKFHWTVWICLFSSETKWGATLCTDASEPWGTYLWDKSALWGFVTLRWSWRHCSEEQAWLIKDPQVPRRKIKHVLSKYLLFFTMKFSTFYEAAF